MRATEESGYRPNRIASNLRRQKARMFGGGVSDVENPHFTHLMSIWALEALPKHGVGVPEEIALVAVDDQFWAELVEPPLTTLAQPVREMVDCAVDLLLERIASRWTCPWRVVFDFQLKARGSCGTTVTRKGGL